jgi:NAD(P)-dependent dehydrogenase (short-subunit alcohol dehydrogenase family)
LGAQVVLLARNEDALKDAAEAIGPQARYAVADVTAGAEYRAQLAGIDADTPIDILVNNAGTIDPIARFWESDPDDWARAVQINLMGVYDGTRAVLPSMIQRGRGKVVNLSSGAANSALPGWSHYCTTKAAVQRITQVSGRELREAGHEGVSVIGLSPGTVATDMMATIRDSGVNAVSQLPWERHIPAHWAGRAVAWLCGPEGAAHSGTDFSIKTEDGRRAVGLPLDGAPG